MVRSQWEKRMNVLPDYVYGLGTSFALGRLRTFVSEAASRGKRSPPQCFPLCVVAGLAVALVLCGDISAQTARGPGSQVGAILGTVTDVNGDTVPSARVVLSGPTASDSQILVTGDNGFFRFGRVKPEVTYQVIITAEGRTEWKSAAMEIEP